MLDPQLLTITPLAARSYTCHVRTLLALCLLLSASPGSALGGSPKISANVHSGIASQVHESIGKVTASEAKHASDRLHYYGARYYDPRTSVWQSTDPVIVEETGRLVSASRGVSAYTYAFNHPLNCTDPDGRFPWLVIPAAIALGLSLHHDDDGGSNIAPVVALTPPGALVVGGVGAVMTASQISDLLDMRDNVIVSGFADDPEIQSSLDDIDTAIALGVVTGTLEGALTVMGALGTGKAAAKQLGAGKAAPKQLRAGNKAPNMVSRGSTGRTAPKNLREKLAMAQAKSNPAAGRPVPNKKGMTDKRWHKEDGWQKMSQNINDVEIHYVRNARTGAVDDFKFKD